MKSVSPFREISNKAASTPSSIRTKLSALPIATGSEKRSVKLKEDDKPPVMRNQIRQQDLFSSEASNDVTSCNGFDIGRRAKTAGLEKFLFHMPNEILESAESETSSGTSSAPTPFISPEKLAAAPPQLVIRSPMLPVTSYSAPVSVMTTPLATPRSAATKEARTNLYRLNSLKKIGRELSKKLDNINVVSAFKASNSKSPLHNAISNIQQINPLENLSENFLENLAGKIRELKNNPYFQSKPASHKNIILHAEILQNLPLNSEFRTPAMLKLLLADANERIANEDHEIDIEVDLNDPAFSNFLSSAAHGAFIKPWERDSSDIDQNLRQYLTELKNTFVRDFKNSDYFIQDENGIKKKLTSIDEFIKYFRLESNPQLPMIISNIASQNLGNFAKNALFLRNDSNEISQSLLKRRNGTPIMPLALAKASYVFSKNIDGSFSIDYTWLSSKELNGSKEIRAKEMIGNFNTVPIKNASIEIKIKVNVEPDGQWTMLNPHLKAKGWG